MVDTPLGKLWKGFMLDCRSGCYKDRLGQRLFVNYEYKIEKIDKKEFTIYDDIEDVRMTIPTSKIRELFKLPYASTVHSMQGLSYDGLITIKDLDSPYVDANWSYTALSRVTTKTI